MPSSVDVIADSDSDVAEVVDVVDSNLDEFIEFVCSLMFSNISESHVSSLSSSGDGGDEVTWQDFASHHAMVRKL